MKLERHVEQLSERKRQACYCDRLYAVPAEQTRYRDWLAGWFCWNRVAIGPWPTWRTGSVVPKAFINVAEGERREPSNCLRYPWLRRNGAAGE